MAFFHHPTVPGQIKSREQVRRKKEFLRIMQEMRKEEIRIKKEEVEIKRRLRREKAFKRKEERLKQQAIEGKKSTLTSLIRVPVPGNMSLELS